MTHLLIKSSRKIVCKGDLGKLRGRRTREGFQGLTGCLQACKAPRGDLVGGTWWGAARPTRPGRGLTGAVRLMKLAGGWMEGGQACEPL
jgi:hypothetical protein